MIDIGGVVLTEGQMSAVLSTLAATAGAISLDMRSWQRSTVTAVFALGLSFFETTTAFLCLASAISAWIFIQLPEMDLKSRSGIGRTWALFGVAGVTAFSLLSVQVLVEDFALFSEWPLYILLFLLFCNLPALPLSEQLDTDGKISTAKILNLMSIIVAFVFRPEFFHPVLPFYVLPALVALCSFSEYRHGSLLVAYIYTYFVSPTLALYLSPLLIGTVGRGYSSACSVLLLVLLSVSTEALSLPDSEFYTLSVMLFVVSRRLLLEGPWTKPKPHEILFLLAGLTSVGTYLAFNINKIVELFIHNPERAFIPVCVLVFGVVMWNALCRKWPRVCEHLPKIPHFENLSSRIHAYLSRRNERELDVPLVSDLRIRPWELILEEEGTQGLIWGLLSAFVLWGLLWLAI